jgi:hypothetical protein
MNCDYPNHTAVNNTSGNTTRAPYTHAPTTQTVPVTTTKYEPPATYSPKPTPTTAQPSAPAESQETQPPAPPPQTILIYFEVNATLIIPGDLFVKLLLDDFACAKLKSSLLTDLSNLLKMNQTSITINVMTLDNATGDLRVEITIKTQSIVEVTMICNTLKQIPNDNSTLQTTTAEYRSLANADAPPLNVSSTVVTASDNAANAIFPLSAAAYSSMNFIVLFSTAALLFVTFVYTGSFFGN